MRNYFTPDGIIALCILVSIILCTVLWILIKARQNDGVAEIPSQLLFGWDGAAWGPNIIVINKDYWNKKPLIAHERCHQAQQRRDGLFTFWWRYTTSKQHRQHYEVAVYRLHITQPHQFVLLAAQVLPL
jgi:hypothetical protein